MRAEAENQNVYTTTQTLTITDGILATSSGGRGTQRTPTAEVDVSESQRNHMGFGADDDNNNDSFTLDVSGLVEGIERANRVDFSEIAQQVQSLPPVSPLRTPPHASRNILSSSTNAAISPRRSALPTVRSPRRGWYSQSVTVFVKAPNTDTKADAVEEESRDIPDILLPTVRTSPRELSKDVSQDTPTQCFPEVQRSTVTPDDKADDWYKPAFLQDPEKCAYLLETPKKCSGSRFEQKHENIWNRSKPVRSSPPLPYYCESSCFMLSDAKTCDEEFDSKEINESNNGVSASASEAVEKGRNENSFEILSQIDFDSPEFRGQDSFTSFDSRFNDIPRELRHLSLAHFSFYYRYGIPSIVSESEGVLSAVREVFRKYNDQVDLLHMKEVCQASGLCPLWKRPLYDCIMSSLQSSIAFSEFAIWWEKFQKRAHDEASRFVYILTNGSRDFLTAENFEALIQDLLDTHFSLSFLKEAVAFHQAYIKTVIARIFWTATRSWNGRISLAELRLSNILKAIKMLETSEINEEHEFFSYQHFYVIYCKFYMLDTSEKNCLTPLDLALYSDGALTKLAIQRIFSGAVSSCKGKPGEPTMDYTAFVNFLLAEVDKCHPKSIEYWFRVMDLNGDGRISYDEMACFYSEVLTNVLIADMEALTFTDIVNMLKDMISPRTPTYFTLSDLKRSPRMASYFFNTFVNWMKHVVQESGTPDTRNEQDAQISDWDRYCSLEHEILTAQIVENDEEVEDGKIIDSVCSNSKVGWLLNMVQDVIQVADGTTYFVLNLLKNAYGAVLESGTKLEIAYLSKIDEDDGWEHCVNLY